MASEQAKKSFESLFYPGTTTLINHFGEFDPVKLAKIELDISTAAGLAARTSSPIVGNFDIDHLKKIHIRLFGEIYPWAGEVRDYPLFKKRPDGFYTEFARPSEFTSLNEKLRESAGDFAKVKPYEFAEKLSRIYQIANDLHPFREGNGRTHRIYLSYLAKEAGYSLNFSKVEDKAWNFAASVSAKMNIGEGERIDGRLDELRKVFAHISSPIGEANAYQKGRDGLQSASVRTLTLSDLTDTASKVYGPRLRGR